MGARIVIVKALRRLTLYRDGEAPRVMPVALGSTPVGHKTREGDGKTPEGDYYVCTRNARSKYHLSLGLSYPNASDAAEAFRRGEIDREARDAILDAIDRGARPPWDTPLGGFIMIHGGGTDGDWTAGCVALADEDMDQLWLGAPLGTPVRVEP